MTRLLIVVALLALMVGCGTPDHVRLAVTPADALYDSPMTARASGLNAHEKVDAELSLPDASRHTTWRSRTTVGADAHGRLELRLDRLMGAMRPDDHRQASFYPAGHRSFPLTMSLSDGGHRLASVTVERQTPQSAGLVTTTRYRPATDGVFADLYEPTRAVADTSAVMVIGGSEGGMATPDVQAAALAAHGHPALAVAYFKEPGLPQRLLRIPIEYFRAALEKLTTAPHVDAARVYVWGTSRGSEAAALVATQYPTLVHGVIDAVPSSIAHGTVDGVHRNVPAWTIAGRGVPVGLPPSDPDAAAVPGAKFRFQDFPGRVLAVCAGDDELWPSCPFAEAIRAEAPSRVKVLRYAHAGHLVALRAPYLPSSLRSGSGTDGRAERFGGTNAADAAGEADAWPQVLAFLSS